ncbi:hypothetical protein GCM10022252_75790 [Streptosporangium oxazolinicum]|uniref:DUF7739 domain-containing protein n=1 Tax=Streptosporangium oxazolinicum TaxID=909287 RepID=A0ABP8BKU8_9ACTN
MGIRFGDNAGTRPCGFTAQLAEKITKKGGNNSTGAAQLLAAMREGTGPRTLRGEEAEQAAASLTQAARRLRGDERRVAEQIAADARAAADSGKPWTIG